VTLARAESSSSSSGQQDSLSPPQQPQQQQQSVLIGGGDAILPLPPPSREVGPRFAYTPEEAIQVQLQARGGWWTRNAACVCFLRRRQRSRTARGAKYIIAQNK
jgi:hypothetical protein